MPKEDEMPKQALNPDSIGSWTPSQLMKYVQDGLRNDPPALPTTASTEELTVTRRLTVADELLVTNQQLFHVIGAAGEPAFQNSWTNFTVGSYKLCGFWIDAFGIVHLRGMLASGTVGSVAFTLPPGFRPAGLAELFGVNSNTGAGRVDVNGSGQVIPVSPSGNAWVTLSGITFKTVT